MRTTASALAVVAGLIISTQAAPPAKAQGYPTRSVTLIVPLGAGGAMDIIARSLGPRLADRLGKPVVIENRTGGGTVIAATAVAKAAPDGHTLLIAPSGTLSTNATLYKKLPYDPVKDFVPLALYAKVPFVLVVNPSLPVHSVADLIKLSKEKPLSYGSTGIGAAPHLAGEMLKTALGIEMTHVPYKGMVQSLTDVIAGHIELTFGDPAVSIPLITEGKVRALGVSSITRVPVASNIPPLTEVGVPGFEAVSWHLIVAPAHTPREIVDRLHSELKSIMASPEMQRQLVDMGLIPIDSPAVEDLRGFVNSEIDRWGKLVHQAGIAGSE
jgi:tripartite-type tricarboxylate transporter receptor subunit TctC